MNHNVMSLFWKQSQQTEETEQSPIETIVVIRHYHPVLIVYPVLIVRNDLRGDWRRHHYSQ